ncbi:MAG: branched-chain amino acid ABC transporter permease [Shinella sp.]|nr:branched-chain amino acid ABC transporter permease [Shinella sp.]
MSNILQYILSGLAIGGIYALVALGFHIMWSAARAVNFSHGDTLMVGAVSTVVLLDAGLPLWAAASAAMVIGTVFGLVLERLAVRPFASHSNDIGWMLTTIAIGIMAESLATMEFGGFSRPLPTPGIERAVHIGGAGVYPQELLIPVVAILAMAGLYIMQKKTLIGRAMRAVAHDKRAAALMGIDVNRIVAFSFGLASLSGAAAGILVGPVTQVSATMGVLIGLKGFAVAIIGGITSAPGVVVAGLLFGVMEKFVEGYGSTAAREIVGFCAMIIILLIFPQGIFGKREVKKV